MRGAAPLLPYQRAWVEDDSRLKIVAKPRQAGYSFALALRAVLKCLERKLTWVLLSAGERQSKLLMEKVQDHVKAIGIAAPLIESNFMEGVITKQLEVRFPNGSVIYGLPANPDTARGYSGNVTLDEFALNKDQEKIYAALYPTITRGYGIEVVSTPMGKQGKYYELAKLAGLVDGETADPASPWSAHRIDIFSAAAQGLADSVPAIASASIAAPLRNAIAAAFQERGIAPSERMVNFVAALRAGAGDDDEWLQEYCAQFVSTAENFIPPELVSACVSPDASIDVPLTVLAQEQGEFFLGIDIGRVHDRTVFWLDRVTPLPAVALGGPARRLSLTRVVHTLHKMPFDAQLAHARALLQATRATGRGIETGPLIRRASIDATGMGAPLAEFLQQEFGARVEPVTFTALVKEDLAFRVKRRMEAGETLLPESPDVRRAFGAIKKVVLPGGQIRFDAERSEAGHADQFWAKALADLAAEQPGASWSDAYIAEGTERPAEMRLEPMVAGGW